MLIRHLPQTSATVWSEAGEPGWTLTDHLLATVVDTLAVGNWRYVCAHSGKRQAPPHPKPMPRFGSVAHVEPVAEAPVVDMRGLASFLVG